jgi:hypothetical protein
MQNYLPKRRGSLWVKAMLASPSCMVAHALNVGYATRDLRASPTGNGPVADDWCTAAVAPLQS